MRALAQDYFSTFGLAAQFSIDQQALDQAYRTVQMQVHPDKFVQASEADRRRAMQTAAHVNSAYQTLRNPIKRAAYLCELRGVHINIESDTRMPMDFLVQQMAWRESMDEALTSHEPTALNQLAAQVNAQRSAALDDVARLLDGENNPTAAAAVIRKLMFIDRIDADIGDAFERI